MSINKLLISFLVFFFVSCSPSKIPTLFENQTNKTAKEDESLVDQLFFEKYGDIWHINITHDDLLNITNTSEIREGSVALSPDGKKVAFTTMGGELHIMNIDGTNREMLPLEEGQHESPAWSHDGSKIVYNTTKVEKGEAINSISIYDLNLDTYKTFNSFPIPTIVGRASFSPDDKTIVFIYGKDIYTMSITGDNITQLTQSSGDHLFDTPRYSPDGKKIAFASYIKVPIKNAFIEGDNNTVIWVGDIFVMNSDGTDIKQLTDTVADERNPIWITSGKRILYQSFIPITELNEQVFDGFFYTPYVMNSDGSQPKILIDITNFPAVNR